MGAVDDAVTDIFSLDDIAGSGTYTPQGGQAVSVRVVDSHAREDAQVLTAGTRRSARTAMILQSEVATKPKDGDTLVIGADTFRIRSADPDVAGTVWQLDMDKQ